MLEELIGYYVQLLAIMNPFSALPTFMSLTEGVDEGVKKDIVVKALIASLVLVAVFTLVGNYILMAFNISLPALRIGGGVVLMAIAIDMLGGMPRTKRVEAQDIAVVPLATPMVIGPGTITTILLLTSRDSSPLNTGLVLVAGLIAAATTFLLLRYSEPIIRVLRQSTVRAVGRFMSLIIASIAAEMIAYGVIAYYHQAVAPLA